MAVTHLRDSDFQGFTGAPGVALVDFGAAWCPPCVRMDPIVDQISAELPKARVGKVDCDASPAVAAEQGVMGMPTFMVFKEGRKVEQFVGAVPKATLADALKRHL